MPAQRGYRHRASHAARATSHDPRPASDGRLSGFEALILERLGAEGRALLDARPDSETTIDLALDTLDALAAEDAAV